MNSKSMSVRLNLALITEVEEAVEAVAVEDSRDLAAQSKVLVVVPLALSHSSLRRTNQISSY